MMPRTRKLSLSLVLSTAVTLGACATSKNFSAGEQAEQSGRYDEAVNYYIRALAEDPANPEYRQSLDRVKIRASDAHAMVAHKLRAAGDLHAAREEMELAIAFNPADINLATELEKIVIAIREGAEAAAASSIDEIKRQARETPMGELALNPEATMPSGFVFRDASLRDILISVGKMAGVNVVFDVAFVDQPVSIELRDTTFEEALGSLCKITNNFYLIHSDNIVTVAPDTPAKRREYEQQVTKTFYLSTADLKETIDVLRIVLGARRVAPHTPTNALTIVDNRDKVAAAERIINTLDRQRGEVVVELELLEVDRNKLDEYGIQFRSAVEGQEGITTALVPQDGTLDQSLYTGSNIIVSGLPGVVLKLLHIDGSTRILANPKLRAIDGQTAQAEFGDRVPVPITTFTPIATGGLPQQPVTTFEYENIGVNIEIVPRIHHNDEITLELSLQLSAISGTGFGGLPTFGNRSVNTVLRLRDGETSLLAGLIREEERTSLTGTPGLSKIPVLGRIFSVNKEEATKTDIVLTLTPRIVRRAGLSLEDLRSYIIEGGTLSTSPLYEAPAPVPQQQQ